MDDNQVKQIIEAAIFAADSPLSRDSIKALFDPGFLNAADLGKQLDAISEECEWRGIELKEVASGFRFQVKTEFGPWVARLWQEKPPRYSRAMLETLAIIAYRQPTTRGEIEDIRGVSVSSQIIKTLMERAWVRVVGQRDVPGRPSLYATTKQFLDYFDLKSLDQLPTLAEIRDLDEINRELAFDDEPAASETEVKVELDPVAQPVSHENPSELAEESAALSQVDTILDTFDSRFRKKSSDTINEDSNS